MTEPRAIEHECLLRRLKYCDGNRVTIKIGQADECQCSPLLTDWPCEAYGHEGLALGIVCFFAEASERMCLDQNECHQRMELERDLLFNRLQELALNDDELAITILESLNSTDQLLNSLRAEAEDQADDDD